MTSFDMNKKNYSLLLLFCVSIFLIGCGQNKVSGKVVFSDDKTPLNKGILVFYGEQGISRGEIKPDGTYSVTTKKPNDGLPKGEYIVVVQGTEINKSTPPAAPVYETAIDPKYGAKETTDLKVTVKGSQSFNIEVDRFKK